MTRTVTSATGEVPKRLAGHGRQVFVGHRVARLWHAQRQTDPNASESFGVLIGTVSMDGKSVWLEAATTPKRRDQRWRHAFKMRDPGHERTVCRMFGCSQGKRIYLGTWHTHPHATASPSFVDRQDWARCTKANPGRPLAFAIVGTEEVAVFVRFGRTFRALQAEAWHGCI